MSSSNWHNIPGIEFHFNGPWADPEVTYNGVRDTSCVIVEDTMWERWAEDNYNGHDPEDLAAFSDYMLENADEVKYLIDVARGLYI